MSLPVILFGFRNFVADTWAQSRSAGMIIGLAAVTAVCVVFCLGVSVNGELPQLETRPWEAADLIPQAEAARLQLDASAVRNDGVDVPSGELSLVFGLVRLPLQRQSGQSIRLIQVILAGGLADTVGVLFALLWTASFLPGLLEPGTANILLAKPLPRSLIIAGKFSGILAVVLIQSLMFVALTWLALGLRTGAWDLRYFLAVPILLVHFGVFLSISALIAVFTRSAVACALGTMLVWAICFGINLARHETITSQDAVWSRTLLECTYWVAPKPLDYNLTLAELLQAADHLSPMLANGQAGGNPSFVPELSIATGLAFAAIVLGIAGWRLSRLDY